MRNLVRVGVAAMATMMIVVGGAALASEKQAPDYGSYEFKGALETGGLPAGPGSALVPGAPRVKGIGDTGVYIYLLDPLTGAQTAGSGEALGRADVGGSSYRVGVDGP